MAHIDNPTGPIPGPWFQAAAQFANYAAPDPGIRVRLLGSPEIHTGHLRLEARISPLTLLVFAMLVLRNGEPLSRDEAAFTLWPDYIESDARAALRRHLYKLHQTLPAASRPWLACDAKTIRWLPSSRTWVDVAEFERLSEAAETLEAAATLYRGEFAPYVDHPWAGGIREGLRRQACRVFERVVDDHCAQGNAAQALHYVEQLLGQDPWREDAVRKLMSLRYRLGDRAGAVAYYRRFRTRLRAEFDVEPMPQTVACLETIVSGS